MRRLEASVGTSASRIRTVAGACLAAALFAAFATGAAAQEPADSDTTRVFELPPVRVETARGLQTADRVPAALSIRDRDEIQLARPGVGLEESLAAVPGVVISNRHNLAVDSRVSIRGMGARAGFGVRGVRLLLDGIPLTMPDGQATLNNLALGSTGTIEVIRGPASALHGNAAGGVIAMRSEEPPRGFGGEARVVAGDLGTRSTALRKLDVKLGGSGTAGDYMVTISRLEVDGFREHSRAEHTVATARARSRIAGGELVAVLNAAHMPVAENPGSLPLDSARLRPDMAWPFNRTQGAGKTADQIQAGVGYGRPVGSAGRIDIQLHGIDRSMHNPLTFAYITLDRTAGGARVVFRDALHPAGRPLLLTAGVDTELQRDERREFQNDGGAPTGAPRRNQRDRVAATAPFIQAQLAASNSLEVLLGIRYDALTFSARDRPQHRENPDGRDLSGSRRFSSSSQMAGVLYRPADHLALYANVATSFQTPTTTELLNAPPPADGVAAPDGFNQDLQPERASSVEVGIRGARGWLRYELVAFRMRVRDLLVPFQSPAEPGRDFFRNAAAARHIGLEAAIALRPAPEWSLEAAYTRGRFQFTEGLAEHVGNRVPGVPPQRLFGAVRYRAEAGLLLEGSAEAVSGHPVDDENLHRNPGYTVVDVRIGWDARIGPVGLMPFVAVTNLLDTRYNDSVVVNAVGNRFYEPSPGRAVQLGLSAPWRGWGEPARRSR